MIREDCDSGQLSVERAAVDFLLDMNRHLGIVEATACEATR